MYFYESRIIDIATLVKNNRKNVSQEVVGEKDAELYSNFINSLRSKYTKITYGYILKRFLAFHHIEPEKYSSLMIEGKEGKERLIKLYILHLVGRNISTSVINTTICALRDFYEINDVEDISWRKMKKFAGEQTPYIECRCYTDKEIYTMISNARQKLKVAILLMASAGLRIGALESILVGHLERRKDLYKISVYKGLKGKGHYYTFCTPEAAAAIDSMLESRRRLGEKIDNNSPLFRKDFDTGFLEQVRKDVHPWKWQSIHRALYSLLVSTGLTSVDHTAYKRKDVKMSHGLRSFFVTQLVNAEPPIHDIIIKKLSGHAAINGNAGREMTQIYSKQSEERMLTEYEKAIDLLTIDPNMRLQRKVQVLESESDNNKQIIIKTVLEQMREHVRKIWQELRDDGASPDMAYKVMAKWKDESTSTQETMMSEDKD